MTLAAAREVSDELRQLWDVAIETMRLTRGGNELLAEALDGMTDPLEELTSTGSVFVEVREGAPVGFAVVRERTIVGVYVVPEARRHGVARAIAAALFSQEEPPRDALALPGDRATKSLYESLGLKARLLTMRAE